MQGLVALVLPQQSLPADRAGPLGFLSSHAAGDSEPSCVRHWSTMGPGSRSLKGMSGPAPTRCVQTECFDHLVRHCVSCRLLRTPEPRAGKRRSLPHGLGGPTEEVLLGGAPLCQPGQVMG